MTNIDSSLPITTKQKTGSVASLNILYVTVAISVPRPVIINFFQSDSSWNALKYNAVVGI